MAVDATIDRPLEDAPGMRGNGKKCGYVVFVVVIVNVVVVVVVIVNVVVVVVVVVVVFRCAIAPL